MRELFKLKRLYVIALILTGIIFIILVNFNYVYKSKGEVLVIFKSEKAIQSSEEILENFKIISQSVSFYKKVLSDEPDTQNELILELPDYKQEQYWNKIVKMERIGKSSVLRISANSDNPYTAQILNSQTVKTFIGIVGSYYDIEKDIDIRIINPSMTEYAFSGSYIYLILESVVISFILTFVLAYFLNLIIEAKPKKKIKNNISWSYKKEVPKTKVKKDEKIIKKAVAPENLPIFDDSTDKELKLEKEIPLTHEATPEEVKARLNKLLNGEL